MALRIALFGIYHESNTFIDRPTTITGFTNGHWLMGKDILDEYRSSFHEIGGMIEELEGHDVEIVPISFAEATPGGVIAAAAYERLLTQLIRGVSASLPVDACLIALHGAAVSEHYTDMDGHWLTEVREFLGDNIPIVGTLDPHANVSEAMVTATDALIPYTSNPHVDQRETGRKAARILMDTINKKIVPVQYLCSSPVVISIEQQHTQSNPCLSLYQYVDTLVTSEELLHISINLGFPYADVHEMGTSFIIIANGKEKNPEIVCRKLKAYMKANQTQFVGERRTIDQVFPLIKHSPKPVLLLDMGDNIGGGSAGNSLHLLRFFQDRPDMKVLCCLCEPDAVQQAVKNEASEFIDLLLKDSDGSEMTISGRVLKIVNGKFSESDPRHGGQVNYNMGTTAIVQTHCGTTIMLMSNRIPPFSLQQFTAFGLNPEDYDVVIAKGVIAPIAAYGPVCKTIFQVDTPGQTQANMTNFPYKHRRKPLFPFENVP